MLHRWVALEAPRDPLGAGDGDGGGEEESIEARDASRLFVAKHQREILGLVRFGHSDLQLALQGSIVEVRRLLWRIGLPGVFWAYKSYGLGPKVLC